MADNNRKLLIGQVLASKMQKTAVVRIDTHSPHPVYKKYVNQSKKNIIMFMILKINAILVIPSVSLNVSRKVD
jgi:ribosomal protein S17